MKYLRRFQRGGEYFQTLLFYTFAPKKIVQFFSFWSFFKKLKNKQLEREGGRASSTRVLHVCCVVLTFVSICCCKLNSQLSSEKSEINKQRFFCRSKTTAKKSTWVVKLNIFVSIYFLLLNFFVYVLAVPKTITFPKNIDIQSGLPTSVVTISRQKIFLSCLKRDLQVFSSIKIYPSFRK